MFDTEGYSYENSIMLKFYGDDAQRKLQEGHLNPGREVKGWVAYADF